LPDLAAGGEPEPAAAAPDGTLQAAREEFERRYIRSRYRECGGNMSRTAEALGVERSNLYRKMKAYGLLPARRDRGDDAFEA
jgi:two-component system nitrogen regulation response regulator NtrX